MAKENETCVIDSSGVGKVCITNDAITFSLTDKSKTQIKSYLEKERKKLPVDQRGEIDRHIEALEDKKRTMTVVPFEDVNAYTIMPYQDSKNESVMALSMKKDFIVNNNLDKPFTLTRMSKNDINAIESAMPRSVKKAKTIKKFSKIVENSMK